MTVKINLLPEYVESIKNNKVTFVKNFSKIENRYDFNLLISFFERIDTPILVKSVEDSFFKQVFQIRDLESTFKDFKFFKSFLQQVFKYLPDDRDGCDIFFSFKSTAGSSHMDPEDVFIVGLEGVVTYKTFEEKTNYYEIHKGDLIYIPKGVQHKVIGMSPRITLFVGFNGNK
jgi:mannose-6-phosphate isomerase-like protein (cupin superfamily)